MPKSFFDRLASVRLTLLLLALLAGGAAVGTTGLIPQGFQPETYVERYGPAGRAITLLGLDRFHYSIPYRLLFLALLANLTACGYARSISGLRSCLGKGEGSVRVPLADREKARERLAASGFNVSADGPILAKRRLWAFAGFSLVHLSPLLVAVGGLIGSEAGFVGTANVYVGSMADSVRDWKSDGDVVLPIAVEVRSVKREFHPLTLRMGARTRGDGVDRGVFVFAEGERWKVEPTAFEVVVDRFDPDANDISYRVFEPGESPASFTRKNIGSAPVILSPIEYRGDVRRVETAVSIFRKDKTSLGNFAIAVNEPAVAEGYRIYLTNWGADDQGKPYVGLQISKDPGELPMWVGAVLMTIGLCVLLYVEGAWVREEDGFLAGRSTRNRRRFAQLLKDAGGAGP